jgi:hypothetical protein
MPQLFGQLTGSQWNNGGPQTAAQRFFAEYAATVDAYGFTQGSGSRFYAQDVLFHNQNNAEVSCSHLCLAAIVVSPENVALMNSNAAEECPY